VPRVRLHGGVIQVRQACEQMVLQHLWPFLLLDCVVTYKGKMFPHHQK
jgi:hypothetical protein